ncbi:MAG: bacterioferritin-associated ferredoxin [Desulfomonilaceae bacterium]
MALGSKNPNDHDGNQLICYCFGYTRNNLEQDFMTNGKSLIMEKIMAEKKIGECHCATNNPSGK